MKTWFSLFFIPLIPYSSKHFLVCPICSNARAVSKGETQHFAGIMPLTAHALAGQGEPDTYARSADSFWQQLSSATPPTDSMASPEPAT